MSPINYTAMQVNPQDALMQGVKTGLTFDAIAQQAQQQEVALQQQKQALAAQQALQDVLSNPNATPAMYGAVSAMNPKFRESIKDQWDRLDTAKQQSFMGDTTRMFSALQSGRGDIALQLAETQLKAAENAGDQEKAKQLRTFRDMIEKSPDVARTMIGSSIAALPGGDKYFSSMKSGGDESRAAALAPATLEKTQSDALKASIEAKYADQKMRADISNIISTQADRTARLGLDREKFNLDFDTKLNEILQKNTNTTLSAGMEKMQAESVGNALVARTASDRAVGLAEALKSVSTDVGGKPLRWLAENAKRVTGSEDGYTALRQDYVRIRNQGLLSDLPPGPASDKDIALMKDGFPTENQSPEYIANWLESYARVQKAISQKEEAKAEWISNVGSLRNAGKDITIGSVTVPAGTSFVEFIGRTQGNAPKPKNATGYMNFGR